MYVCIMYTLMLLQDFFVQCAIATDGSLTFALFLYSFATDLSFLVGINDTIGFSRGNGVDIASLQSVTRQNVYRLDGTYVM